MKNTAKILGLMAISALISATSCNKGNSDNSSMVPDTVKEEFYNTFPNASNVSWNIKGNHAVARFNNNVTKADDGKNSTAWFLMSTGKLEMTESDLHFSQIPQAVKDAFEATEYSKSPWIVDEEVDKISRKGDIVETLYEIEVEKEINDIETSADLYFTSDGILAKEIIDSETDDDFEQFLPSQPSGAIDGWLDKNYPGARIVEIGKERNGTEVDFIYKNNDYEAFFDNSDSWVSTSYDIKISELPSNVKDALSAAGYTISDNEADVKETSQGRTYELEVQKGASEYEVIISEEGKIISERIDD